MGDFGDCSALGVSAADGFCSALGVIGDCNCDGFDAAVFCSAETDFFESAFLAGFLASLAACCVLFSVTTVDVLIVLSLGTKLAPKWAEKQGFFYSCNIAQSYCIQVPHREMKREIRTTWEELKKSFNL